MKQKRKTMFMGYKLLVSRCVEKPFKFEQVGNLFDSRHEAETYHWRFYRELPYRITGVRLDATSLEIRKSSDDFSGGRKGLRLAA